MSAEQDTYYRVLQQARAKGADEHDARRLAYLASQEHKIAPTKKRRKK